MKVLYCKTTAITSETVCTRGILEEDKQPVQIKSEKEVYCFDEIQSVGLVKINGLGTMVKVQNGPDTLFFAVPRLFIDKGTGFAIINLLATRRAYQMIKQAKERQDHRANR